MNNTDENAICSEEDPPASSSAKPRGLPEACIFVASLSHATSESVLAQFFSNLFGEVAKSKIVRDPSGYSQPYAFVQFTTDESAERALAAAEEELVLEGRRLRIEKARVNRTLFVAKIPRDLTTEELRSVASGFGEVEIVTMIKSYHTNTNKGCAFIKFLYREDAMDALLGLRSVQRKWVVEWARSRRDPDMLGSDKCHIFVGGLDPRTVSEEWLAERFGVYGEIDSVNIVNAHQDVAQHEDKADGGYVGSAFAFVRFCHPASSVAAIENENGVELGGRYLKVQYSESDEVKMTKRQGKSRLQGPAYPFGQPFQAMPPSNAPMFEAAPPTSYANQFGYYYPVYYPNQNWNGYIDPRFRGGYRGAVGYPQMAAPAAQHSPPASYGPMDFHLAAANSGSPRQSHLRRSPQRKRRSKSHQGEPHAGGHQMGNAAAVRGPPAFPAGQGQVGEVAHQLAGLSLDNHD
eukprot:TRINITY_DN3686_c0_g1_i1.p1 TRINITY_DN3686_c0_g1~~TRINITY_DN3686_c0_g1_i1.p1  ORF type:complete len:477 (+),score=80.03 TRINITY_DN3686_c0_g1_i1:48-1433(+)